MRTIDLSIQGMSCGHCVKAVEKALSPIEGIARSSVEIGSASISFDETKVTSERIVQAIQAEGYQVAHP